MAELPGYELAQPGHELQLDVTYRADHAAACIRQQRGERGMPDEVVVDRDERAAAPRRMVEHPTLCLANRHGLLEEYMNAPFQQGLGYRPVSGRRREDVRNFHRHVSAEIPQIAERLGPPASTGERGGALQYRIDDGGDLRSRQAEDDVGMHGGDVARSDQRNPKGTIHPDLG